MAPTLNRETYGNLLAEYQPQVISTEDEYNHALESIQSLVFKKNRTVEQNSLLALLVALTEAYEKNTYPIEKSSPHEVLLDLMEARGLKQADLVGILGSSGVVSEVANGKRSISKAQAKALSELFHVSPALFL